MPTIKLPSAADSIKSGTLRKWLKPAGHTVARGDAIVEVETEAGLLTIESPVAGRLSQILIAEGKTALVHAPLAVIEDEGATPVTETSKPSAPSSSTASAPSGKVIPILMPK